MRDVSPREQWTDCEASRKEVVEGEMRPVTMRDSRLHYSALFNVQNEQAQTKRVDVVSEVHTHSGKLHVRCGLLKTVLTSSGA
jgi:hypothetical protein